MTTDTLELDGKTFVPAEQLPIPEWPCVLAERPQPTLTIKDNDLFLVTDTLGNIAGCLGDDTNASMGCSAAIRGSSVAWSCKLMDIHRCCSVAQRTKGLPSRCFVPIPAWTEEHT
jgi:hypothetical protein